MVGSSSIGKSVIVVEVLQFVDETHWPPRSTCFGAEPQGSKDPRQVKVVLISTYELGRQPFGLASAAAWLREAGASVTCLDLSIQRFAQEPIATADLVAFYVPMHTATRLATTVVERVKAINPSAHLCFFGLYAPVNAAFLRRLGAETILGGEFEAGLVSLVRRLSENAAGPQSEPVISLARQHFLVPDRSGLPGLERYAHLNLDGTTRHVVGYTEASRGCKHLCRHCPIVPVYGGRFRIVPREVVLEDIRRQVAAGARHITFGDPDFFNGPGHALPLVEALHREFPDITYDVTIKIEHLLKHSEHLTRLRDTGCLFVTSAVESIDDSILEIFDKRHTRADFIRVVALCRDIGLVLCPTFVTFTPWTTLEGYRELLALLAELDLVDAIAPVQLAIRLLIPAGSRLLALPAVRELVDEFDEVALCYPWSHPDPAVDQLCEDVLALVKEGQARSESRREIFEAVWKHAHTVSGLEAPKLPVPGTKVPRVPLPHLTEPWFC